jgi:hypothetical protein
MVATKQLAVMPVDGLVVGVVEGERVPHSMSLSSHSSLASATKTDVIYVLFMEVIATIKIVISFGRWVINVVIVDSECCNSDEEAAYYLLICVSQQEQFHRPLELSWSQGLHLNEHSMTAGGENHHQLHWRHLHLYCPMDQYQTRRLFQGQRAQ